MSAIKTLALVGGISSDSLNQTYYKAITQLGLEDFEFETFDISKLPFFSKDLENDPPDVVTKFKECIREAQAVLFITPEYNRSYPAVLKNAIDWGSRPYGQNLWDKKPAAVLGASPGATGTFGAQHHLRQVLAYLNMPILGQPEIYFGFAPKAFDEKGNLKDEKTKELLQGFFSSFHGMIDKVIDHPHGNLRPSQGLEDSPMTH